MDLSTPSSNFSNFWQIFYQKLSLEIHFSNMWIYLWDCYIKCYFIIILSNSDLFLNVEEIIKTSRVNIYSNSKKAEKEMNVKCFYYFSLLSLPIIKYWNSRELLSPVPQLSIMRELDILSNKIFLTLGYIWRWLMVIVLSGQE